MYSTILVVIIAILLPKWQRLSKRSLIIRATSCWKQGKSELLVFPIEHYKGLLLFCTATRAARWRAGENRAAPWRWSSRWLMAECRRRRRRRRRPWAGRRTADEARGDTKPIATDGQLSLECWHSEVLTVVRTPRPSSTDNGQIHRRPCSHEMKASATDRKFGKVMRDFSVSVFIPNT